MNPDYIIFGMAVIGFAAAIYLVVGTMSMLDGDYEEQ